MTAATEQTPQILGNTYPTTLLIDGRDIRLQIKRLDLGEWTTFDRDFGRVGRAVQRDRYRLERNRRPVIDPVTQQPKQRPVLRAVVVDGRSTDQMEPTGELETVLETDLEVLARLDDEETDEQREVREKRNRAEDDFLADLTRRSITAYVACEPNQLYSADGPVTNGADLLKLYGARESIVTALFTEIYLQNALSEEKKKELASQRASSRGSSTSSPTANGVAPAPTAGDASPKDSANSGPATVSTEDRPSGSMATTS